MITFRNQFVRWITALLFVSACKPAPPSGQTVSWESCLSALASMDHVPVLDERNITLYSSHDRSGGNNDFNNFHGPGSESGWVTLVDLNGPGCIRRLWMTGTDPGHPIRIYIDGDKTPRVEMSLDALFGATSPWTPPLAQYVNMCYYSYVPITYAMSIRIEIKEPNVHPIWGPRRIFYQVAAESFSSGTRVESYPKQMSQTQLQAAAEVGKRWTALIEERAITWPASTVQTPITSGQRSNVWEAEGSGNLVNWQVQVAPANDSTWSRIDQEYLLQDSVLRVYYDGQTVPSIETPLGVFFANAWRKRSYGSAWFTSSEDGYACRLPLPYAKGIRIEIENGADRDITVQFHAEQSHERAANYGYLHAEYRRSGPEGAQPHLVTRVNGKGKFLGCFLGVTGLDQSWWILEGDERMWVDGNSQPVWLGTGLEDYFNGGWYYRGSVFGALNANFDRSPFRVAQFRHQHPDPVSFTTFFQMEFERMKDERSGLPVKGWFQSVAYFYLEKPSGVAALPADRAVRRSVENPNHRSTTMIQLVELERANDFHAAKRLVEEYLERYPGAEEEGVFRLRHLEYRRYLGEPVGNNEYAPFLTGIHGETAKQHAELLVWFYEQSDRALVGLNSNGKTRLFLNNQFLLSGDHPYNLFVVGTIVTNGSQRLAAQTDMVRGDAWVQAGIRTRDGVAGFGPGTMANRNVETNWRNKPAVPPAWQPVGIRQIPRGVPDAPYIGGIPNAFILVQSKSYPVTGFDWAYHQGTYYFIKDFEAPVTNWPSFSSIMTGLQK